MRVKCSQPGRAELWPHSLLAFLLTGTFTPAQDFSLQTGNGSPLQTLGAPLIVPAGNPILQCHFGFSTSETNLAGGFLDSFSFTLQSNDGLATALLLTADAHGVSWSPPNPGGVILNPNDLLRTPVSIPGFAQGYHTLLAYEVSFLVPSEFSGKPATLYLDLFDNLELPNSLGWADNIAIVPEPSVIVLGLFGLAIIAGRTRPRAP